MNPPRPLILFLPGWLGAAADWEPVISRLAPRFPARAFEPAGFGSRVDEGPRPWTLDAAVEEVAAHIRSSGERSVVVAGTSIGGTIALACAARKVAGVVGAVTVGTAATWVRIDEDACGMEVATANDLAQLMRSDLPAAVLTLGPQIWANDENEELAGAAVASYRQRAAELRDPDVAIDVFIATCAADIRSELGAVALPTLLIFGDRDAVVGDAGRDDLTRRLPRAEVRRIPGAGHLAPLTAPGAVAAAIGEFAGRLA